MIRIPTISRLRLRGLYMTIGGLVLAGLALAACGGGSGSSPGTSGGEMGTESAGGGGAGAAASGATVTHETVARAVGARQSAVVKATVAPGLGTVITDSEGMTLYDSHRDNPMIYQFGRPPIPSCYEACTELWPPLLTDLPPKATGGAEDDLLGTIRRRDGSMQVTYDGHPLYESVEDTQPGEANGDDLLKSGSEWHALEPDGEEPADPSGNPERR